MKKSAKARRRLKGGALLMFTAMLPTIILPMVGLAIDGTIMFMVKAKLSSAVDGGAIAAARSLSAGLSFDSQKAAAVKTAEQFVKANFPDGYWGSKNLRFDPAPDVQEDNSTSLKRRTVSIEAQVDVPLLFMRIFGKEAGVVAAEGVAARRDVRLVLVLDRSSSMSGVIEVMKGAAVDFVNRFAEGRDQVGLVVFGGSAIVAFPPRDPTDPTIGTGPADNFKSQDPSIPTLINSIKSASNTGMTEALYLGWQELKKSSLPGALNLIVLFTDGLPNGITAEFNIRDPVAPVENVVKGTSTCTYRRAAIDPRTGAVIPATQMFGFVAQHSGFAINGTVRGVYSLMNRTQDAAHPTVKSWLSSSSMEPVLATSASINCEYREPDLGADRAHLVPTTLTKIPPVDAYGNKTTGLAYQQSDLYAKEGVAYDATKVNSPYHIGLASWNATDDVGKRIRADPSISPVIYTIGYYGGSEWPDQTLMKRLSNVDDPDNTAYDPNKPAGLHVLAPTPAQIANAFGKVASEILRLCQ